jgi:hypothetical protein
MNRAEAISRTEKAFDDALKLVEVLCTDLAFDPSKAPEYVAHYHTGIANAALAHKLALAELDKVFPEGD